MPVLLGFKLQRALGVVRQLRRKSCPKRSILREIPHTRSRRFLRFPYQYGDIHIAKQIFFGSFPYRHGDIHAADNTKFCSFPYRHGDIHVTRDTGLYNVKCVGRFNQLMRVARLLSDSPGEKQLGAHRFQVQPAGPTQRPLFS